MSTTQQPCYMQFPITLTSCSESDNNVTLPSALTSWATANGLKYRVAHVPCSKDRLWNEAYIRGESYSPSDPALATGGIVLLTHSGHAGSGITADGPVLTLHWAAPASSCPFGLYIEPNAVGEWRSKCESMGIDLICPLAAHALDGGVAEILDHVPDRNTLTERQGSKLPEQRPYFVGRIKSGNGEISQTWPSLEG